MDRMATHRIRLRPVFVVMAAGCSVLFLGGPLVIAVAVLLLAPLDVSLYIAPARSCSPP